MSYRTVVLFNALLFGMLALGLLAAPAFFVDGFGLVPSVGAEVMARRAGMIFAGLTPLYYTLARIADARLQRSIARSSFLLALGLALLGLVEWTAARVGPGVMVPVTIELVFSGLYAPLALRKLP